MTDRELFPEEQLLRFIFSDADGKKDDEQFKALWGQEKSRKTLHENFGAFLAQLPPRECQILRLSFGLFDGWKFTPEEISEKLGLKVDKVNLILTKLIKKIRDPKTIDFLSQRE